MKDIWYPALELVPHRPPMLLVDFVRLPDGNAGSESAEVRSIIKESWPVIDNAGMLMPPALFEVAAQSFAAMAGLKMKLSGSALEQRLGFLVALKRFNIMGSAKTGDELVTTVSIVASLGEFSVVQCEVRHKDTLLAEGQLKVYCPTIEEVEKMFGA